MGTTFTNITTAAIQARWLAEMLKHGLPSKEVMWAELREKQAWIRDTMPYAGAARSYMMQTHQIHYYDELLQDMGASVCRKRGWFASIRECFEPYRPRDYDTIVTGTFRSEKAASKSMPCFGGIPFIKSFFQMASCKKREETSEADNLGPPMVHSCACIPSWWDNLVLVFDCIP